MDKQQQLANVTNTVKELDAFINAISVGTFPGSHVLVLGQLANFLIGLKQQAEYQQKALSEEAPFADLLENT